MIETAGLSTSQTLALAFDLKRLTLDMKSKRIGILGGTFNPIHKGHLHIASAIFKHLDLDELLFIPSHTPPHKETTDLPSARHRMEMVRLALLDTPHFKPCDLEIETPGPSYTIHTVEALQKANPNNCLFFIIGMDAFSQLHRWKEPERLMSLCSFAIVSRPGHPFTNLPKMSSLKNIDTAMLEAIDSKKSAACSFKISSQTNLHFISIPHSTISATEIRQSIARAKDGKKRLPQFVESYIIKNRLYLNPASGPSTESVEQALRQGHKR